MNELAGRISESELEVMRVLWAVSHALPLTSIRRTICEKTGWESSTAKTLISRLAAKGVIRQEKRDVYYYTAVVTEQEYREYSTQHLLDRLFAGNAKKLVASLVSNQKLSEDDITELYRMFRDEVKHE